VPDEEQPEEGWYLYIRTGKHYYLYRHPSGRMKYYYLNPLGRRTSRMVEAETVRRYYEKKDDYAPDMGDGGNGDAVAGSERDRLAQRVVGRDRYNSASAVRNGPLPNAEPET
jgi:hypothetical protein